MKNHKIFKKYKDALSYANDLIDGIKGEVLFDDAWDDYLINGENTGDCKLYKNGKFIKTINTDDNYKWSNLIMLYKKDDGFMVYTNFEFDESKKSARKSIKESINYEVEGLYFFNFDVGETCSIDLKDAFNADGVISEFYKNENRIYSIVVCSAIDYYFFISYDYRKKKVIYSECFSSYQNAKNKMRDWLKNI